MPFYLLLDKELRADNIELKVFAGIFENKGVTSREGLFHGLKYFLFNVNIGGLRDKLVLLPGLPGALYKYRPDLIVSEDISAMPNCLSVWLYSKLAGKPYLVWGPGSIPNKKPSRIRVFMEPLISVFRKNCDAFIGYSSYAKDYYERRYKAACYVAYNSTAPQYSDKELAALQENITKKYALEKPFEIIFIGRLLEQKKVDILLEALSGMDKDIPWRLHVIGDGPEKPGLERAAAKLGLSANIIFYGAITDPDKKAEVFLKGHLGVLPGLGGLAIQELMRYGVPVVSSWADGTEQELIREGGAGIFIPEMTAGVLRDKISGFFKMPRTEKCRMAERSIAAIKNKYNLDSMVAAFKTGVQSAAGK